MGAQDGGIAVRAAVGADLGHGCVRRRPPDVLCAGAVGRCCRSLLDHRPRAAVTCPMTPRVMLFRDDGPVALALGRVGAGMPWLLALVGIAPAAVIASAGLRHGVLLGAVVWAVVLGGISSRASHTNPLDWTAVPLLRTGEYAVIAMTGLAGDVSPPLVFALLCAIAFHDYDTVDRVRQGRSGVADRTAVLRLLGLGWDGRMLAVAVGLAAGGLMGVFVVGTAYLWVLFAAESASGWLQRSSDRNVDGSPA